MRRESSIPGSARDPLSPLKLRVALRRPLSRMCPVRASSASTSCPCPVVGAPAPRIHRSRCASGPQHSHGHSWRATRARRGGRDSSRGVRRNRAPSLRDAASLCRGGRRRALTSSRSPRGYDVGAQHSKSRSCAAGPAGLPAVAHRLAPNRSSAAMSYPARRPAGAEQPEPRCGDHFPLYVISGTGHAVRVFTAEDSEARSLDLLAMPAGRGDGLFPRMPKKLAVPIAGDAVSISDVSVIKYAPATAAPGRDGRAYRAASLLASTNAPMAATASSLMSSRKRRASAPSSRRESRAEADETPRPPFPPPQ